MPKLGCRICDLSLVAHIEAQRQILFYFGGFFTLQQLSCLKSSIGKFDCILCHSKFESFRNWVLSNFGLPNWRLWNSCRSFCEWFWSGKLDSRNSELRRIGCIPWLKDSENGRCQIWVAAFATCEIIAHIEAQYHILCFRELSLVCITLLVCEFRFTEFGN